LYRELGQESKKIKLEITTNRTMHESTQFRETGGTTKLDDETIIKIGTYSLLPPVFYVQMLTVSQQPR
jgi:hypothetical protein